MGRIQAVSGAVVLMVVTLIATSAGKWLSPEWSHDFIKFTWDTTGFEFNNETFVKFVVQLYKSKNNSCDDVIHPPMVEEIPVFYLQEATFTRLNLSNLYCSNCTIVTSSRNISCGKYNPILIVSSTARRRSFNTTVVTNTSITVTWPTYTQQNRAVARKGNITFYYYKLDASPHEPETNSPLVIFNETMTEGTLVGLTPGKEYQVQLLSSGDTHLVVEPDHLIYSFLTTDIIATDPSPAEDVLISEMRSTSMTLNLIPPNIGFVDLFQIQATSLKHSSPLVDVPFPDGNPPSVEAYLSNLQPETTYNLSVTTVAKGKRGQAKVVTFTTEPVPVDPKVVGSVTSVAVVAVIAAIFCTVRIVKRLKYRLDPAQLFKDVLEDIVGSEKMEPWLKNRKDLHLENLIGEGEFGHVRKGLLKEKGQQNIIVAAKTLRVDRANEITYRDFAKEASLLIEVNDDGGHVNIVSLIGLVVDGERKKDPRYILVEYAEPGELLWYLVGIQNNRYQADFPPGLGRQLTEVAIDIARGMLELKHRKITHRDLACRNIVLSSPDGPAGRLVAKISDFGLARDVYVTTQYMRHPLTNVLLPIKWMAIESLLEGVYSCKSDMWGFGVVLWEIATLGGTPYPEVCGYETLVTRLRRGFRLQKPNGCSDELYELMNLCWLDDPDVRPTPDVIENKLEELLHQDKAFFPET